MPSEKKGCSFTLNYIMKKISSLLAVVFLCTIIRIHAQLPGSVDLSFECGFYSDNAISLVGKQSDGKIILAGELNTFNSTYINQIVRLNPDYTVDPTFNPGTGFPPSNLTDMLILPDDKILISGDFLSYDGHPCSLIVRLNADGSFDPGFNAASLGLFYAPEHLVLQTDGKIIFSGGYLQTPAYMEDMIVRMNSNGTRDSSFHINLGIQATSGINALELQSDGKLIVGGLFYKTVTGENEKNLMRLKTNGMIDNTFQTNIGTAAGGVSGNTISQVEIGADNSILLLGKFTSFNGTAAPGFIRLFADGTIDPSFSAGTGFTGSVSYSLLEESNDNHIYVGGTISSYNGNSFMNFARLNHDGSFDTGYETGTVSDILIEDDESFLVVGSFDEFNEIGRNNFVHVFSDGTIDPTGLPVGGISGGIGDVRDMVITSDQKTIIAGDFRFYNNIPHACIVKINADGSPDSTFNVLIETTDSWMSINDMEQLPDGKIYIAGDFTKVNGVNRKRIARLNADGSLDLSFSTGSGANDDIYQIGVQPDGKIIIAGLFNSYAGNTRKKIARLNSDGTLDLSFDPGEGPNSDQIFEISFQSDNKILIGGMFTKYNGLNRKYIARINTNGTLDATFNAGTGPGWGPTELLVLPDDKIIITGSFTTYNGVVINNVARLNSDGTLDATAPFGSGFSGIVDDVDILEDGSYLFSGGFSAYNGIPVNDIAFVNADGSLHTEFDPGYGGTNPYPWYNSVEEIEKLNDGNIMIMGDFSSFNGVTRDCIARVFGLNEICTFPSGLFADNITTSNAKLHWDLVPGADIYQVYYRAIGAISWSKKKTSANYKILNGLTPNTIYEYKIRTDCGEGYTAFSPISTFTTLPLRINTVTDASVVVFPNPSDGNITLQYPDNLSNVLIQLYDIKGNLIAEKNTGTTNAEYKFTIENYTGIVFIRISDETSTVIKKIVMQ